MRNSFILELQDMKPDDMFADKKFAQELELSKKNSLRNLLPAVCEAHSCSSRIEEIDKLYKASKEQRMTYYAAVKELYKNNFPLGGDSYLSGGNHFHIFFKTGYEINELYGADEDFVKALYTFIKSLPFYAKFKKHEDGTRKFYSRRNWGHSVSSSIMQTKSYGISAKLSYASSDSRRSYGSQIAIEDTSGVQSVEFRMNSNIDDRIYGLYQAAILYAIDKSLGTCKSLGVLGTNIYQGIRKSFVEEDCDSP